MRATSPGALWSRSDLRARVVSLLVLGALVGMTIGLAAAAYDGARRTDSALSRLQSRTNASDAVVFATQADLVGADWNKLAKRPEVKFRSPLTAIAVIVVIPVALIAANLLAVIPARRASKSRPALVLRSE